MEKENKEKLEDNLKEEKGKGKLEKSSKKQKSNLKSKKESKSRSKSRSRSRSRSRSNSKNKSESKPNTAKTNTNISSDKTIKVFHWNIAGLRPILQKGELDKLIKEENPDFICFNETKIDDDLIKSMNLEKMFKNKYNYKSYWYCSTAKKGYAGTGILVKNEPISVSYGMNIKKHDGEGRIITLEYDKFYLISCYTPNAGEGLKRIDYRVKEWDKDFFEYINSLKNKKDIILTGDLNVARENIDIFDPKGREKLPGFSKLEKESFAKFLNMGYIDTFRNLHPTEQKFSFFSKRTKGKESNRGWRLDYFIINKDAKNIDIKESDMLDKDKYNSSDHIPIFFKFNLK
jgi:exodeoxyribonuclease III